jgi:hypothetical protein
MDISGLTDEELSEREIEELRGETTHDNVKLKSFLHKILAVLPILAYTQFM